MSRLTIITGTDEGRQIDLVTDCITIGRDGSNRVRLHDTEVSRRHAELHRSMEGYRLVDIGSANGTFVNRRAIHDVKLRTGDEIQLGQTVLLYSDGTILNPQVDDPNGADDSETGDANTQTKRRTPAAPDLASRIHLISRQENFLPEAIKSSVGEHEGSKLLSKPESIEGPWIKKKLGVIYEAMQAVSQILDLDELLDRLMDLVIRTLDADRGCVMLRRPEELGEHAEVPHSTPLSSKELEPRAIHIRRNLSKAGTHRDEEQIVVSRTIMEYVLEQKKGILVSDVTKDERFGAVQSVVRAGIREVICVPMRGRHETLGLLYVDCSAKLSDPIEGTYDSVFTEDHLALAIALAHQAALAVEDTRFYQGMLQAERLAAVGHTIASVSHHIKNILQNLRSGSELLKMGIDEEDFEFVKQGWHILDKNQRKIYDMVLDMLSFSKEREPVIEMVDLRELARDIVELLATRANERGISLTLGKDEGLPEAPADREGLHRALLNIVSNAVDAVEECDNPKVEVSCTIDPTRKWFQIVVEDNGPGISKEQQATIFRPFSSSKGARGTGLGLPVSRKVLREHGGDILVESESGQGTRFLLRLPIESHFQENDPTHEVPTAPPPN